MSHDQRFENQDQAQGYLETIREHYRDEDVRYKGTRNDDQRLIEMVTADEARLLMDGAMAGLLALSGAGTQLPKNYEESVERAGFTWGKFRGEYERALSSAAVASERLNRKGFDVPLYTDLSETDRLKVASELLSDFQAQNALRFGVDGVGIPTSVRQYKENDEGELRQVTVRIADKDKAKSDKTIDRNMAVRGYTAKSSAHTSLKHSTPDVRDMRLDNSTMDADEFYRDLSYLRDAKTDFQERE